MEFMRNSVEDADDSNFADFSDFSTSSLTSQSKVEKISEWSDNSFVIHKEGEVELASSSAAVPEAQYDNFIPCWNSYLVDNGSKYSIYDARQILNKCFFTCNVLNRDREKCCIESKYIESQLFVDLNCEFHDPVKACDTLYYKSIVESLVSDLQLSMNDKCSWLKSVDIYQYGLWNSTFDFHSNEKDFQLLKNENEVKNDNQVEMNSHAKHASQDLNFNGGSICLLELEPRFFSENMKFKELSNELILKSLFDLHTVVETLSSQVKINSEILLQELTIREQLQRHNELQNTFIAAYMNVERKIAEINKTRKKKNRFVFIKYAHEQYKNGDISIPYLKNEGGPTSSSLLHMTKILQGIEKDDENVPKLISEYILSIGSEFDLKTELRIVSEGVSR